MNEKKSHEIKKSLRNSTYNVHMKNDFSVELEEDKLNQLNR